jgi:hypothetical protein
MLVSRFQKLCAGGEDVTAVWRERPERAVEEVRMDACERQDGDRWWWRWRRGEGDAKALNGTQLATSAHANAIRLNHSNREISHIVRYADHTLVHLAAR